MTSFDDSRDQSHTFSRYAPALVSGGYSPVPIQEGSKRPLPALGDWSRLRSSPLTIDQIATIGDQHPYAGIGIVGGFGGVVPIDIDTDDPEITATIHSVLPATEVSKRGRRGSTLFFRCLEPISARKFRQSGGEGLLEILTSGQTVIPPTRHPQSGKPYEWADERYSLFNVPVNDLSIISAAHIAALESELSRWTGQPRISGSQTPGQSEEIRLRKCAEALLGSFFDRLQAAPEGSRNQLLFQATCTLGRFVHHGFLLRSDLERTLFEACDANGLMSADGRRACEATIVSGLRKAEGDEKPKLGDIESYSRSADSEAPGSKHSSVAKERGAVKRVDSLIDLALEKDIDLYHSRSGVPFADIVVDGHRETWPINGDGFRLWLRHSFYREVGGAVSGDVIKTALATLESMAIFDGEEREVFLRVAQHDTRIFLDLCDARWRAIEIDRDGWRIVDRPDVRFRRTGGMLEIPEPVPGSNIDDLRQQLNLGDESFVLAVSWLLAVLRGRGPYPILALSGEQGTGKSLSAQLMRSLVDPHEPAHGSLPRDVRDLYIGAINRHVLAFDNISSISTEISDCLCRLSTGGGFTTRALFTDSNETVFNGQRPIVLTSIGDVASRSDLADRLLIVRLEVIPEGDRRTEADCLTVFEALRPRILGALLNAVSHGLKQLPDIRLTQLPRMADFAVWATACETAMWTEKTFMRAYDANRSEAFDVVLEADAVAMTLLHVIASRDELIVTPSQLLDALNAAAPEQIRVAREIPTNARALSARLSRLNPAFRRVGIFIESFKEAGTGGRRLLRIQNKRLG